MNGKSVLLVGGPADGLMRYVDKSESHLDVVVMREPAMANIEVRYYSTGLRSGGDDVLEVFATPDTDWLSLLAQEYSRKKGSRGWDAPSSSGSDIHHATVRRRDGKWFADQDSADRSRSGDYLRRSTEQAYLHHAHMMKAEESTSKDSEK